MISDEEARDLRERVAKLEQSLIRLESILFCGFLGVAVGWAIQHFG